MAVTATPVFTQSPKNAWARVTTANTNYDSTGTLVTLFTAGANGSKVSEIVVECEGTSAAAVVCVFIDTAGSGGTWRLYDTFTIAAVTASATVAPFRINKAYDNFLVQASGVVKVTTTVTQNCNVNVAYGDY
jgi:hypothetical protein